MALLISRISFRCFLYAYFLSVCLLFSLEKSSASLEGRKVAEGHHPGQHSHNVQLSSLLPSSACKLSSKEFNKGTSLKLVHKHGPCYQQNHDQQKASVFPNHTEILRQDQLRVNSIHSKISGNLAAVGGGGSNDVKVTDSTRLPAKDGRTVGSGNYIVTVGLGTPKRDLSLIFDTGSDLTWTQCQPCAKSCYKQKEPIFNPSQSASYSNISCSSSFCSSLTSATGIRPRCTPTSTCVYVIQYGDSSFSLGYFSSERLTLTSTDVFDNFLFGCGQNNQGLFGGAAGLLGLGRDKLSLVSQAGQKYKKIFSYCLPSTSSSDGFLIMGGTASQSLKYTPISTISAGNSFYGIDFTGISVAGTKLSIPTSVFSTAGAIIDSGTIITRLPPGAYSALRSTFRQQMSKYPTAPSLSILDTCYDFHSYKTFTVPKISFFFKGGLQVDIDIAGIFYVNSPSQVCLAFAGNSDPTDTAIFGNVQQQTLEVAYDGAAGRLGFAPGGCS